ncbi:unnamed protein product [Hydatigera taeniaeformis]|uniref:Replication protein A3 n=1 Tax=Hydatigena taeniaeformis TaxID=6205 RepID=A0A0R3X6R8_HYDTA|nr:unnamed protein product [Hydatigera taeniaeformis]
MEKRGPRFRIVGALIPRLENREVCILGKALSVDASGQRITLQCADGTEVRLATPYYLTVFVKVSPELCIVEVQGLVTQAHEIQATADPVIFSQEASNNFDLERYAYAVNLTATFDGLYMQSTEE